MNSILHKSKILKYLENRFSPEDNRAFYAVENNQFYLLWYVKSGVDKQKLRCLKKLDGFKIFANRHDCNYATTDYYVLDLKTQEVFAVSSDTCVMGSYLDTIVKDIDRCAKPEEEKKNYDFLTDCW